MRGRTCPPSRQCPGKTALLICSGFLPPRPKDQPAEGERKNKQPDLEAGLFLKPLLSQRNFVRIDLPGLLPHPCPRSVQFQPLELLQAKHRPGAPNQSAWVNQRLT